MNNTQRGDLRTLGILGGMGPEATALLFQLIIRRTPVSRDADHIPICIYNFPQIPDRTRAIYSNGSSPVPYVIEGLKVLEQTPAMCVLIPCNTVFYFYNEFKDQTRLPIVHLINATAKAIKHHPKKPQRIGVLATNGTRKTGLYEHFLAEQGLETIYPDETMQQAVMQEIYNIKAGKIQSRSSRQAAEKLRAEGADLILLACTELSIVHDDLARDWPVMDALRVLADVGVRIGLGQVTPHQYTL